jgi:hypothetical protein
MKLRFLIGVSLFIILPRLWCQPFFGNPVPSHPTASKEHVPRPAAYMTAPSPRGVNPRVLRPFGIYANAGGPAILGGSVDYFVKSYLEVEAGGGMNAAFAGLHYHFTGARNVPWTPYAGIMITYTYSGSIPGVYIPGGFQMVRFSGIGLRFEAALWIQKARADIPDAPFTDIEFFGYLRLALGYHF